MPPNEALPDLSSVSDADLMARYVQSLSDEELKQLHSQSATPATGSILPTAQSLGALNTDFENQMLAAGQRTTPILSAHAPNLVSADLFTNELGELQYKDPATGELRLAENNKHVYLRDPSDNKLKLFARTPNTDESKFSAAGRILLPAVTGGTLPLTAAPKALTAAQQIGVELPRAAASESMGMQRLGKISAGMPFGTPLIEKSQKAISQLEGAVNKTTEAAGGIASPAEAGESVQKGINVDVKGKISNFLKDKYGKVDALIDPDIKSPLSNTLAAANDISSRRQVAALPGESAALKGVMEGVTRPEGMTYGGIKDLRTNIGDLMKEEAIAGRPTEGLNQIYGALSDDLRGAAGRAGGAEAVNAFDVANAATRVTKGWQEQLDKVIGPNSRSAEGVIGTIRRMAGVGPQADIKTLELARKTLPPEAWQNVASSVINQLGRDKSGVFSPTRFVSDYAQISPQAKQVLFNGVSEGNLLETLENVNKVSNENFKKLDQFANTSRTAGHSVGALGALEAVTGMVHGLMSGSPREAAYAVAGPMAAGGANSALARFLAATPRSAPSPNAVMGRGPGIARPAVVASDELSRPQGNQPAPISALAQLLAAPFRGAPQALPSTSYPALPLSR